MVLNHPLIKIPVMIKEMSSYQEKYFLIFDISQGKQMPDKVF